MSFQTKGKLHLKQESQQVTEKFRKREFVLEIVEGTYPEYIKFQLVNDKCTLLDKYNVGDEILVSFNLRGKPFQSKTGEMVYYTNLDAWRVENGLAAASPQQSAASQTTMPAMTPMPEAPLPDDDNLPF